MRNQNQKDQNPGTPDQGRLPPRDRSNVDDVPGNAGATNDRTADDPRIIHERRAPGAESAEDELEDELDDEDFEGEDDVRR